MKTAVEWLVQELKKSSNYRGLQNIGITHQELFEQAKEMEKKQIINANEDASTNELGEFLTGEQYYNQEYGNETTQELE